MELITNSHPLLHLAILIFATARISYFVAEEDGPFEFMDKLRYAIGVRFDANGWPEATNSFARGLICIYCNSPWIFVVLFCMYEALPLVTLAISLPFASSLVSIILAKKLFSGSTPQG